MPESITSAATPQVSEFCWVDGTIKQTYIHTKYSQPLQDVSPEPLFCLFDTQTHDVLLFSFIVCRCFGKTSYSGAALGQRDRSSYDAMTGQMRGLLSGQSDLHYNSGFPRVHFAMLGIAAKYGVDDLHYSTKTAKNAVWLSFVNNIRF